MARDILANTFFRLMADDNARIVWLIRTTVPFASVAELEQTFDDVAQAVSTLPREWGLLIDSREGPMRNDPEFERALAQARVGIVAHFARVAVLVKSAVGKLQVARYAREDNKSPRVFDDEDAAITSLLARPTKRPSKP